ncbi:bc42b8f4-d8ff-4541-849f-55079447849d [Thermothielavioides terrestris]|uniref:Bc42b8f4-d8ff-4541-849f-55079447849d n=1 Tax=Thermothielavioides terrestris TaxID=2587410 RepID=A0A3S4AUN7_9PEZI|nr:bc42b8f4-d8ff-4541-849f-55079447849d [Thermothielavioides terrestris]
MVVQQHVLNWLYSVLTSEYHDVNRTYNDVAQALSQYPSLSPRTDVYTFPNGTSALLLHLSGTIPVLFRGATYRFPISLWVPHAYPREPPLVYVTPTETMMVRPGQHVDPQGQVYHPYLVGWPTFWDKSTILDFLAILRDVFAKEPPVVSRQQAPPLPSQQTPTPPPVPPLPPDLAPKPASRAQTTAPEAVRPPPPPPKPGTQNQPPQQPSPSPAQAAGPRVPPPPPKVGGQQSVKHLKQPPPPVQAQPKPKPPPPPDLMDDDLTLTIPSPSSVPPPPIPPNPEKDLLLQRLAQALHAHRQKARAQNEASLRGLQAQHAALLNALATLQSESAQLNQLSALLAADAAILQDSLRKADAVIESSANHPRPDIDELLVAPTVVGNQLYELVAEERALADAIFVLGRAVERGRVAPQTFAKMTRSLAREWYLKKALVKKIGRGMGLAEG